jgi:hypothetical protein
MEGIHYRTRHAAGRNRAPTGALLLAGCLLVQSGGGPTRRRADERDRGPVGEPAEDPAYLPSTPRWRWDVPRPRASGDAQALEAPDGRVRAARREAGSRWRSSTTRSGAPGPSFPVQVLVAHVRAPAVALLVSPAARDTVRRVEDLQGKAVGIPGPGSTGHLLLAQLLRSARVKPSQIDARSIGSTAPWRSWVRATWPPRWSRSLGEPTAGQPAGRGPGRLPPAGGTRSGSSAGPSTRW